MRTKSDSKYVYAVIALLCVGWMVIFSVRTSLYSLLVDIGDEFNLDAAQLGALNSAYFLLYVAMQAPAGILGDRFGLKRVLVTFLVLSAVGVTAAGLFARSYLFLLGAIALHGLGMGCYYSTAFAITMRTVPENRRAFGSAAIASGMNLGMIIGLNGADVLYSLTGNWRIPLVVLGGAIIALALAYQLVFQETKPTGNRSVQLAEIARDRTVLLIAGAIFCNLYGFWVALTWGPSFLRLERGLSPAMAGLFVSLMAVLAIPVGLTLGRFSDRIGRRQICLSLLVPAALSIFLLGAVSNVAAIAVVIVLYGVVGKLTWEPVAVAWLGDHMAATKPEAIGTAMGFNNFVGMASAILAPFFSGLLKDLTGSFQDAFYLGAVVVFCGFLLVLAIPEVRSAAVPAEMVS